MKNFKRRAHLYLSDKRSMYIGPMGQKISQSTASSTLIFSVTGELDLVDHLNNVTYRSKSFLIPAGMKATIDAHKATVVIVFLDTLGNDLATLKARMKNKVFFDKKTAFYSGIDKESNIINRAHYLLENNPDAEDAFQQLDDWIGPPPSGHILNSDRRVIEAIDYIKANYTKNVSVEEIAQHVNLSIPRLIQLFKESTGIPIRRFRMWHRIYVTALKANTGLPLTEAAISSGFSDYSQFSRMFKEIAGVNPSEVLSDKEKVKILVRAPSISPVEETYEEMAWA